MTLANSTIVDCRGQRCPAPILATAKAARTLRTQGGGMLEISADDDAFPLDIKSWCRSAGAELVDIVSDDGIHHAFVRVATAGAAAPAPAPVPAPPPAASLLQESTVYEELDCRGQQCPKPILNVARRARGMTSGVLEVIADDPAFKLDIESWCRSSGATIESVSPEGNALRVRVRIGPARDKQIETTRPLPAAIPPAITTPAALAPAALSVTAPGTVEISLIGLPVSQRIATLEAFVGQTAPGKTVRVISDDVGFSAALVTWATSGDHKLLSLDARGNLIVEIELARPEPVVALATQPGALALPETRNQCTLLVLHNDKEALLAALLVGVGAASQGMDVMMFFTFWGLNLLRGDEPNPAAPIEKVSWMQKMMKWMMPKGPNRQRLGQMDMAGIGRGMLGSIMRKYELMDVPELMRAAEEQGVRFVACTMSMQVMGITKRDLAPRTNLDYGGVAAFVESAANSRMSLTF